jgi:hypothetical protein
MYSDLSMKHRQPASRQEVNKQRELYCPYLRVAEELVLGVVGLVQAVELGLAVYVSDEAPRVEAILAVGHVNIGDQLPLILQLLYHIRLPKDATRLGIG